MSLVLLLDLTTFNSTLLPSKISKAEIAIRSLTNSFLANNVCNKFVWSTRTWCKEIKATLAWHFPKCRKCLKIDRQWFKIPSNQWIQTFKAFSRPWAIKPWSASSPNSSSNKMLFRRHRLTLSHHHLIRDNRFRDRLRWFIKIIFLILFGVSFHDFFQLQKTTTRRPTSQLTKICFLIFQNCMLSIDCLLSSLFLSIWRLYFRKTKKVLWLPV